MIVIIGFAILLFLTEYVAPRNPVSKDVRERERKQLETYLGIPVSEQDMDDPEFQFGVSVLMEDLD